MTSATEDATRFLHQACRGLPDLLQRQARSLRRGGQPALTETTRFTKPCFEHALAFFGSRILHPARPALRDARRRRTVRSDPRRSGTANGSSFRRCRRSSRLSDPAPHAGISSTRPDSGFLHRPTNTNSLPSNSDYLAGNDLYDAYLEGRLTTAALRKFFLTHIEAARHRTRSLRATQNTAAIRSVPKFQSFRATRHVVQGSEFLLISTPGISAVEILIPAAVSSPVPCPTIFHFSSRRPTRSCSSVSGIARCPRTKSARRNVAKAMLLEQPLVIGRDKQGQPFALRDACPHRGMPLSCGPFDGEQIECSYHGWRFDAHSGQCQLDPVARRRNKI